MSKIFRQYFKTVYFRWTTYAIFLVGVFVYLGALLVQKNLMHEDFLNNGNDLNWIFKIPLFISLGILISHIVLIVFRTSEKTDEKVLESLLPISKNKILFSKIFILIFSIFLIAIIWFSLSFVFAFLDENMTLLERLKYALSCLIASLVILIALQGIILLLSVFIKVKAVAIISVVFIFSLPILTIVNQKYISKNFVNEKLYEVLEEENSDVVKDIYSLDQTNEDKNQEKSFSNHVNSKYDYTSKFDFYFQFNSLFNIFSSKQNASNTKFEKSYLSSDKGYKMKIENKEYLVLLFKPLNDVNAFEERFSFLMNHRDWLKELEKHKKEIEAFSIEKQISLSNLLITKATLEMPIDEKILEILNEVKDQSSSYLKMLFNNIRKEQLALLQEISKDNFSLSSHSEFDITSYLKDSFHDGVILLERNQKQPIFIRSNYVEIPLVAAGWTFIGIFLAFISLLIKSKKRTLIF